MLAARLMFGVQGETLRRCATLGFDDVTAATCVVLVFLDQEGVRPSELARVARRLKQTIGAAVDELEVLGYLRREPDPADRRAKLIVPTERGLQFITSFDAIVAEIEERHAQALGRSRYEEFKETLRLVANPPDEAD